MIILKSPQGDIIPQSISCDFDVTNNEVQYEALVMELQLTNDLQNKDLQVFVDSLIITHHYNGSYAVKGERITSYLQILKKLASKFEAYSLNQVSREDNAKADALANLGSSLRIPPKTRISIIHVMIPLIDDPSKLSEYPRNHDKTTNIKTI